MDHKDLQDYHSLLVSAFPTRADFEQLVQFGLGENLNAITTASGLSALVFELLTWAQARGRIQDLLRAAVATRPDRADLQTLVAQLRTSTPSVTPVTLEERRRALRERAGRLNQQPRAVASASYYYFYASLDKIERLAEESIPDVDLPDETVRRTVAETTANEGRNAEYRKRCERLTALLLRISASQQVQDLSKPRTLAKITEGLAYAELRLCIAETQGELFALHGQIANYGLQLSCSKRNFFDYDPVTQELASTSTNHWFLQGKQEYLFRSHFWVLSINKSQQIVLGSPIYLALPVGVLS